MGKQSLEDARIYVPVRTNHVLSGIPLHFSCTDLKGIRTHLMSCSPIDEYLNIETDDALFVVCAKVFPMPSSVLSLWMFVGVELPLLPDQVNTLEMESYLK